MDNKYTSKAKFGQEIIQTNPLDRSSAGEKGEAVIEQPMKGGVDYLGHSLKGVSAVQDGNGATKGTKGGSLYPTSRG